VRLPIIDRYLLTQFFQVFAICFCSFTGLYIVIDAFSNLEDFVTFSAKHGSLFAALSEYYLYRTLAFFDATSSILTLVSSMFTLAWFQRNNEMTALMAAGVPKSRIVRPLVIAVGGITFLALLNREVVIPAFRDRCSRDVHDLGGETAKKLTPRFDGATNILFRGDQTFAKEARITNPSLLIQSPSLAVYGGQLLAESAVYMPAHDGHPSGYLLRGMKQPRDLAKKESLKLDPSDQEPVILTPRDYDWLKPDECFVASEVTFEQLTNADTWRQYSSTWQLIGGLHNPSLDFGADVRVAVHARLLQPVLDMTLLFLGLPLLLTRETRNMFLAVGMCLGVVIGFMLVVMACQYLGTNLYLGPALAVWCPAILFIPLAVYLAEPLRE
jgi:lipopolysaccharide export system permease protein